MSIFLSNLSLYASNGKRLPDLLAALAALNPGTRIRLGSLEPGICDDEAISVMASLVEEYGYASGGETFSIADKEEVWIMEMVGKGTKLNKKGVNVNFFTIAC